MENLRELELHGRYSNTRKRLKKHTKTRKKNKISFEINLIIFNILLISVIMILIIMGNTEMVSISSDNLVKNSSNEVLKAEVNALEEVLIPYRSEKRIEKIAMTRMGMVYPQENNYVDMGKENTQKVIELEDIKYDNNSNLYNSVLSSIKSLFR